MFKNDRVWVSEQERQNTNVEAIEDVKALLEVDLEFTGSLIFRLSKAPEHIDVFSSKKSLAQTYIPCSLAS